MDLGKVALIAGEGVLPLEIARRLTEHGQAPLVITLRSDSRAFQDLADPLICMRFPRFSPAIREMRKHGVRNVIMAGVIPKKLIYLPALFDPLALKYLVKIAHDDHSLLGAAVDIFESHGISVVPYWHMLPEFLAAEGQLGHRPPTKEEASDFHCGMAILKVTLPCSFGQALVVADGAVVAIEALEGTDAMIGRAGNLVRQGVLVKMMRADQDLRYDLPAVGPHTIENMAASGLTCLAVEAQRTLIMDAEKVFDLAKQADIAIWGLPCQLQQ